MKKENLKVPLEQDIFQLFKQASPEQIKDLIPSLSPGQLEVGIRALQDKKKDAGLLAAIASIHDTPRLECVGAILSTEQLLAVLSAIHDGKLSIDRLSPLLVKTPPQIFFEMLRGAQEAQLETIKKEGILEPLDYHINALFVALESDCQRHQKTADEIRQSINEIDLNDLTYAGLKIVEHRIDQLEMDYQTTLHILDKALAITWNTNRVDLIEKLSGLKEKGSIQLIHHIGSNVPGQKDYNNGLWKYLEDCLSRVYEDPLNTLQDNGKAVEGLTKLSVWYLKDYWDTGLLPSIENVEDLDMESSQDTPQEKLHHRQQLFDEVRLNLEKLGLGTIADLKNARIFSKNMLKSFVNQRRGVLATPSIHP
jgi:hypothetical protein